MQVIILAGGMGTRLRPLTHRIPKPLVLINNKPFLEHLLIYLKRYNLREFILCVGSLWEKIADYFGDGRKWGINIKYSIEKDKLLDTGGALKKAGKLLDNKFIVLNGDTYLPIDYNKLIDSFNKKGCLGMVTVYDNTERIAPNNIELGKEVLILDYNKKEETENLNYTDAGAMIFNKKVLDWIPANRKVSLEEEIFPLLISKKLLFGYITHTRFYDMGTPERIETIKEVLR